MAAFRGIIEDIRTEIDQQGAHGCFAKSVDDFSDESGIPEAGLWMVVDGVLEKVKPKKLLRAARSVHGGTPEQWERWYEIACGKPDC